MCRLEWSWEAPREVGIEVQDAFAPPLGEGTRLFCIRHHTLPGKALTAYDLLVGKPLWYWEPARKT